MNIKELLNLENILKLSLIVISILIIIYYDKLFPSFKLSSGKLENFYNFKSFLENNNTDYPITVFEKSIMNHKVFSKFPEMASNIIPTYKSNQNKKLFPVHIIKTITDKYIAVFNDGKIYSTDNLRESMWVGPYINSMPDNIIPLRNITTNPEGNRLVGIGYDNKVYIKNNNNLLDLKAEWEAMENIPVDLDIIYLTYYFNEDANISKLLLINDKGRLVKEDANGDFAEVSGNYPAFIKIFYDYNNYMIGLTDEFQIGRFDNKNWETSKFADKTNLNKHNLLLDILYDADMSLFGLCFDINKNMIEIKKQDGVGYDKKFLPLLKDEDVSNKMINEDIIKSKLGSIKKLGFFAESDKISAFDNDINIAYQRQILQDNAKLRAFCKKRQKHITNDIIDLELDNQIKDNDNKIKEIKTVLNNLLNE